MNFSKIISTLHLKSFSYTTLKTFPEGAVKIYSYDMKKGGLVDTYSYSTGASDVDCVNLDSAFVCLSPSLKMAYYTRLMHIR